MMIEEQETTAHSGHPMGEPKMNHAKTEDVHSEHAEAHAHVAGASHTHTAATASADPKAEIRRLRCEMIISKHVAVSVGAGFIPVPIADFAAVTAVQMRMIYQLCQVYDVPFTKELARTAVVTLIGGSVPGLQARFFASGLKMIPGVGTILGMVATPTVSGAVTYAVGRVFVQHLDTGGTLLTFDASKMRAHFEQALKQGKEMNSQPVGSKA